MKTEAMARAAGDVIGVKSLIQKASPAPDQAKDPRACSESDAGAIYLSSRFRSELLVSTGHGTAEVNCHAQRLTRACSDRRI